MFSFHSAASWGAGRGGVVFSLYLSSSLSGNKHGPELQDRQKELLRLNDLLD